MDRWTAALVCALCLASGIGMALAAGPLTKPTARPGPCFDGMVQEIKDADRGQGYGIIFYGDSITETLRGTDKCRSCTGPNSRRSSCSGGPEALAKWFGAYRPGVMGMSMDESAHLLYRLLNGEVPKVKKPKLSVVLIGTNDLTNSGWSITDLKKKEAAVDKQLPGIVGRIKQSAELLRSPGNEVLLLGVLPRGTGTGKGLPNELNDFTWPSHYTKGLAKLNSQLKQYAAVTEGVSFLDCGAIFLAKSGGKWRLDPKLMADGIHPTGKGWNQLAQCIHAYASMAGLLPNFIG